MFDPVEALNIVDGPGNVASVLSGCIDRWVAKLCKKHATTDQQSRFPLRYVTGSCIA